DEQRSRNSDTGGGESRTGREAHDLAQEHPCLLVEKLQVGDTGTDRPRIVRRWWRSHGGRGFERCGATHGKRSPTANSGRGYRDYECISGRVCLEHEQREVEVVG